MRFFVWNLVLAVLWAGMSARFTVQSFVIGFALGYLVLWLASPLIGASRYVRKLPRTVRFLFYFAVEIVRANLRVALDVLTPTHRSRPAILALPLEEHTDLSLLALANLITLTPGTISLDVSEDQTLLYIHAMFAQDPEGLKREIKRKLEAPLLDLLT